MIAATAAATSSGRGARKGRTRPRPRATSTSPTTTPGGAALLRRLPRWARWGCPCAPRHHAGQLRARDPAAQRPGGPAAPPTRDVPARRDIATVRPVGGRR